MQAARVGSPAVGAAQAEAERLFLHQLEQAEAELAALEAEVAFRAARRATLVLVHSVVPAAGGHPPQQGAAGEAPHR